MTASATDGAGAAGETAMTLRVTQAAPAADGILLIELRDPAGGPLPAFTAGAHLPMRVPSGALRRYSLVNAAQERDRYVIAVKRDAGGRGGSVSLVDRVQVGDAVAVGPPANGFALVPGPAGLIFVAGGIGITPILSMIRTLAAAGGETGGDIGAATGAGTGAGIGAATPFRLFYLTRDRAGTAFHDELAADPRVTIHHDAGDPALAFDLWPVFAEPDGAHVYCCGPRPLMDAVRDMTGHWPADQVHFEDFGSDLVRPRESDTPFLVQVADGATWEVPVGASVLEVLRAHGRRVPSSCESGTCGTCRTRVLAGEVDHRDLVLTEAERRGEMMICVSRANSALLVLDL